jgi:sigma-E factor negative regulatory protein RseA
MNDRMLESLSALMDNQANELELERILAQVPGDTQLRQAWSRFNLAQHAMHGLPAAHLDWDISNRVQAALETTPVEGTAAPSVFRQRMVRSLQSFAVAASVAATVVIGGRQLVEVSQTTPYVPDRPAVASASPVTLLNSRGATAVRTASYDGIPPIPVLQPATRSAYQEITQQRMRKYMQEHAEQAALNSPQGLVPFARVPQIRE